MGLVHLAFPGEKATVSLTEFACVYLVTPLQQQANMYGLLFSLLLLGVCCCLVGGGGGGGGCHF